MKARLVVATVLLGGTASAYTFQGIKFPPTLKVGGAPSGSWEWA